MAPSTQQTLVPDEFLLASIFPTATRLKTADCKILSKSYETCTFSIDVATSASLNYPRGLVVRLDARRGRLPDVAAIQGFASTVLPELIPAVRDVGTATTADGREVDYCTTELCTEATTLEDVWEDLRVDNKSELSAAVVAVMEMFQKVDRSSIAIPTDPATASGQRQPPIGGPSLGYFPDMKQFLRKLYEESMPTLVTTATFTTTANSGVIIESEDVGRIEFTSDDLAALQRDAVFCHNDLEPRNILVRECPIPGGPNTGRPNNPRYELAAIVDWESAGFYPFSYEYGLKDCLLGANNRSLTWYWGFKKPASEFVPKGEHHDKLIEALWILDEAKRRVMSHSVGIRLQGRFIEHYNLERSPRRRMGWLRKAGGPLRVMGKKHLEQLEDKVHDELKHSRYSGEPLREIPKWRKK